ncbi:hypothetical protein [Salana multivorans]
MAILVALLSTAGTIIAATIAASASRRSQRAELSLEQRKTDHARIATLEARVDGLETKRERDALLKRRQGDHIDTLEAHIWAGKPPPPPARPEGV